MTKERLFIMFEGKIYRFLTQQFTDNTEVVIYMKPVKSIRPAKTMTTRKILAYVIEGGNL